MINKRTAGIVSFMFFLLSIAKAQTVTLDYYFNHEIKKTPSGETTRFHYLWDDKANTGFSVWGDAFKLLGASLDTLAEAPTAINLKKSAVYIIVDPDTKKKRTTRIIWKQRILPI